MLFEELPKYLQKSIQEYLENKDNPYRWDMYSDELYGDINCAYHDGLISYEEAEELREKYLYS